MEQPAAPESAPLRRIACAWVLAAAPDALAPAALAWLEAPDYVVAADGGANLAERLGLTPDLLVGDLDSADPQVVARFEAQGVPVARYTHETKLETDTELAMLAAVRTQPRSIVVIGAIGGRLDHTLANVMLLLHPDFAPLDVTIVDGNQSVRLAKPGKWNSVQGQAGDTLSLIPVGTEAVGVRTRGLLYPLDGETLHAGQARGVSNELTGSSASVWVESGNLLVTLINRAAGPE